GNARARDFGIEFARGSIVAFPDDDCAYEADVLERVAAAFAQRPQLGVLSAACYEFGGSDFSIGVNPARAGGFSRFSMVGVEFTHFFHRDRLDRHEFRIDHDFGIGSKYSGGEGFELLYRLLRAGGVGYYEPAIRIYHANKDSYLVGADRMLRYSSGVGAYIRKFANQRDVSMIYFVARKMFAAPLIKLFIAVLSRNPARIRYSFNNLVGIWHGFLAYRSGGNTEGKLHA
ncbi:MAG: glycosyltransferase, partial [Methylococcaceae bacterium]|nr:glycosyltransferase [Methylococcaceae bacterium]